MVKRTRSPRQRFFIFALAGVLHAGVVRLVWVLVSNHPDSFYSLPTWLFVGVGVCLWPVWPPLLALQRARSWPGLACVILLGVSLLWPCAEMVLTLLIWTINGFGP